MSPDLDSCDKIMGKFLLNSAKMFVGSEQMAAVFHLVVSLFQ